MFASLAPLFPAKDFTLLVVIICVPLLGALVNGIFGKRAGNEAVSLMALSAIGVSFVASLVAFLMLRDAQTAEQAARFVWTGWEWTSVSGRGDAVQIPISVAFSIDALSGTMALIVTGVGFLIHLYSVKYMEGDPGYHRYFAYLNLFIFSMLVLILGDNLPVLFVGWEGVGLCSYLLIGFWFENDYNAFAGKKAFITNRIGDFGLLVAMALLVYFVGALDWSGIETKRTSLLQWYAVWPIGPDFWPATWLGNRFEAVKPIADAINQPRYVNAATLVGLALFLGCAGKSAQIPLYVWLPDAMAGPTPVSALIHAATMVTAGVYLVCRFSGVFVLSPAAMFTVAIIGAVTAVFAATIALVQNDIKRVLAYSTVSQLGYMFLGVGVGAFAAGFFHVITHAFFKACLFLGAGSVIHALHARIHDTDAAQDMRNMGGLRRFMPITFWTFVAATAAIAGFPLTAGFFSKDEILLRARTSKVVLENTEIAGGVPGLKPFEWPDWAPTALYSLGVVGAVMTAFYMTRLAIGIFGGEFRGWTIVRKSKAQAHAHGHGHEEEAGTREGPKPKESPWQMTLPLVVLGALSLVGGFMNAHLFKLHFLDSWLEPGFQKAHESVKLENVEAFQNIAIGIAVAAFAAGTFAAFWVYVMQRGEPAKQLAERLPGLHRLVYEKWRIDELYEETVLGAVDTLADFLAWADKWIVDGVIARLTSFVIAATGTGLRYVQNGRVHAYAAVMMLGVGGIGWFLILPHATAKTEVDHGSGVYALSASPGLGYRYRWDADGDGTWDNQEFNGQQRVDFKLDHGQRRSVRLEVMNAFGRVSDHTYDFERPKPDRSRGATVIGVEEGPDGQRRGVVQGRPGMQLPGQPGAQPRQPPGAAPGQPPGAAPGMAPQFRQPMLPGQPQPLQPGQPGARPAPPNPGAPAPLPQGHP